MGIEDINREFYDKLYKRKNPAVSLAHSFISFDQQSKSKVNFMAVRALLKERFKNDLTVLDYGFGHGSLLLKYRSNHHLYGCDISEEAVDNFPRVSRLVGKTVQTATVDEFELKYGKIRFDVISLSHIIEHVNDDFGLVSSLSQKLSDGGIILINIPINEVWEDPKHVRRYDHSYIEKMTNDCGLKIVSRFEADKLTSFFLTEEKVKNAGRLKVYVLKSVRLFFAILPLALVQVFEKVFLKRHFNQQLIVVATRR